MQSLELHLLYVGLPVGLHAHRTAKNGRTTSKSSQRTQEVSERERLILIICFPLCFLFLALLLLQRRNPTHRRGGSGRPTLPRAVLSSTQFCIATSVVGTGTGAGTAD